MAAMNETDCVATTESSQDPLVLALTSEGAAIDVRAIASAGITHAATAATLRISCAVVWSARPSLSAITAAAATNVSASNHLSLVGRGRRPCHLTSRRVSRTAIVTNAAIPTQSSVIEMSANCRRLATETMPVAITTENAPGDCAIRSHPRLWFAGRARGGACGAAPGGAGPPGAGFVVGPARRDALTRSPSRSPRLDMGASVCIVPSQGRPPVQRSGMRVPSDVPFCRSRAQIFLDLFEAAPAGFWHQLCEEHDGNHADRCVQPECARLA